MKKLLCFVALVCLLATTAHAQTLGWSELTNTKIRPLCPGLPGCEYLVEAWNSAVMDTLRNRLMIWGGGHEDYFGNEIYALNLNGTPTMERLTNPTASGCDQESCDGFQTPNSRHTYDGIEYMANADRMFVWGGARAGSSGFALNGTWTFTFADKVWHWMNPSGPIPNTDNGPISMTGYDPNTGKVFLTNLSNLYTYTLSTNSYQLVGSSSGNVGYHATGVVDPVRKKFVTLGGGESGIYDISGAGSYNRQALSTSGCSAVTSESYPGLVYDPVTDRIVAWTGGNTVYSLNLDTRVCTAITQYTGGPGSNPPAGTYGRWNYSAPLNAFVIVNSVDQNAFLFRSNTGTPPPPPTDTEAPSVPTGLMASGVTASQVTLSWSASTDNIGVTGYRVERCAGVSCSNFAQVGTPSSTSHSDTGLTASTNYSYRVRATDAAGNLSGYSATISVTTASAPPPPPPGVLTVGSGKQFATVCAAIATAQSGNTIEADAGIYPNESCTVSQNDLTLRGVGGKAHLRWATGDYQTHSSNIPNEKAILIVSGDNVILENLEFSGAKVADENGAGIRYEGGNLTIRNSYFHDNETGLLGQGGLAHTLLIEYSIFERNGYCPSDCAHNIYVGTMGRLIFRHNKSVDSREGHTLKSRAHVSEIISNYLSTKNSDGSYEIDLPNGGTAYVIGNVIEQGANTGNSSIVGFAGEGSINPNPELRVINNTFMNWSSNGVFVQVSGSLALSIKNNIFAGGGTQLSGGSTDLSSNKTSSAFVNAANGDFHLASGSDAINAGVPPGTSGTYDLTPLWEYVEPAGKIARTIVDTIDVGAYESGAAPPPPPPPPTDPCVVSPLTVTVQEWPTARTGSRRERWTSPTDNTKRIVSRDWRWPIGGNQSVTFTDERGCSVTVTKP